jgi:hypothetical protein
MALPLLATLLGLIGYASGAVSSRSAAPSEDRRRARPDGAAAETASHASSNASGGSTIGYQAPPEAATQSTVSIPSSALVEPEEPLPRSASVPTGSPAAALLPAASSR